jgi:hypothetical protein
MIGVVRGRRESSAQPGSVSRLVKHLRFADRAACSAWRGRRPARGGRPIASGRFLRQQRRQSARPLLAWPADEESTVQGPPLPRSRSRDRGFNQFPIATARRRSRKSSAAGGVLGQLAGGVGVAATRGFCCELRIRGSHSPVRKQRICRTWKLGLCVYRAKKGVKNRGFRSTQGGLD